VRRWPLLLLTLPCLPLQAAEFDCITEPSRSVEIRSAVEGLISSIPVERGDSVKTGQVLVTLEAGLEEANAELARFRATMQGAIRSGQSRLEYANVKARRNQQLHEERFVSAQDRDEAETERRLAESQLLETRDNQRVAELEYRRAEEELRRRTVVSPIDGVVVERLQHPGELAENRDQTRPIMRLANTSVLNVEALLPLEAYGRIQPGQQALVRPEDPVGGEHPATVKVVDTLIDTASGTFGVRLELPNPQHVVPAGVKCRVLFADVELPGLP
jgi:RND family efflux transporter MFP subunit